VALTTTTVTGNLQMSLPGQATNTLPVDSSVLFHPTSALTDITDKVYYLGQPVNATVINGEFSAELFNTDNTNIAPAPGMWQWICWIRVANQWGQFTFFLPASVYNAAPYNGTVDITTLMPSGWQI
jgi:hypothetical protein